MMEYFDAVNPNISTFLQHLKGCTAAQRAVERIVPGWIDPPVMNGTEARSIQWLQLVFHRMMQIMNEMVNYETIGQLYGIHPVWWTGPALNQVDNHMLDAMQLLWVTTFGVDMELCEWFGDG